MPKEPTGYEIVVETNDNVIPVDGLYDDLDEMLAAAKPLIFGLQDEQDVGSWKVYVLPHWCTDRAKCDCWDITTEKPVAEFRGMTIADLAKGT